MWIKRRRYNELIEDIRKLKIDNLDLATRLLSMCSLLMEVSKLETSLETTNWECLATPAKKLDN